MVLLLIFLSCEKNEPGKIKYLKAITGGCFIDKGSSQMKSLNLQRDTVTYSFTTDSLDIFVGFNATCCSEYSSSSSVKDDSIIINIKLSQTALCNCICYYTYNFKFSGNTAGYKYHVIGSNLNFSGQVLP